LNPLQLLALLVDRRTTIRVAELAEPSMVILNFTLTEEGVAVLHDALACMFKFSDDVCLEAKKDIVSLFFDDVRICD
jgi:hypothetical protein